MELNLPRQWGRMLLTIGRQFIGDIGLSLIIGKKGVQEKKGLFRSSWTENEQGGDFWEGEIGPGRRAGCDYSRQPVGQLRGK
jgi:hypothetical protein